MLYVFLWVTGQVYLLGSPKMSQIKQEKQIIIIHFIHTAHLKLHNNNRSRVAGKKPLKVGNTERLISPTDIELSTNMFYLKAINHFVTSSVQIFKCLFKCLFSLCSSRFIPIGSFFTSLQKFYCLETFPLFVNHMQYWSLTTHIKYTKHNVLHWITYIDSIVPGVYVVIYWAVYDII